jgi:hypothetical protein
MSVIAVSAIGPERPREPAALETMYAQALAIERGMQSREGLSAG